MSLAPPEVKLIKRRLAREFWPDMDRATLARLPVRRIAAARAREWKLARFSRTKNGRIRDGWTGRYVPLARAKRLVSSKTRREFRAIVREMLGTTTIPKTVARAVALLQRVGEMPRSPKKRKRKRRKRGRK